MSDKDSIDFEVTATTADGVQVPMSLKVEFPEGYGLQAVKMIEKLPEYRNQFYEELIHRGDASVMTALLKAGYGATDEDDDDFEEDA